MKNLASIVTKPNVIKALERIIKEQFELLPSTKYHLIYKAQSFPPKEIVRYAAREMGIKNLSSYSLIGGAPTNKYLEKMGFKIEQFNNWKVRKNKSISKIEKKISRIVWNTNGWKKPSGPEGKSRSKSYEKTNAYGHEEWLLDLTKTINGHHYGFLEPINKYRKKYIGKKFDILLYTVNADTKEKFFIGTLRQVTCIDNKETREIISIYKKRGWTKEMLRDLYDVGANVDSMQDWMEETLFNIKFKPGDYDPLPEPLYISEPGQYIKSARYNLLNRDFEVEGIQDLQGKFVLGSSNKRRQLKTSSSRNQEPKTIQLPLVHNKISEGLEKELRKKYKIVVAEQQTGNGTSIDIVAKSNEGLYFYEIKAYDHIRTCIRIALGQIIEYSYYPDRTLAKKIFIVSQHEAKPEHVNYILHLRKMLNLPVYYLWFDVVTKKIMQEV